MLQLWVLLVATVDSFNLIAGFHFVRYCNAMVLKIASTLGKAEDMISAFDKSYSPNILLKWMQQRLTVQYKFKGLRKFACTYKT